MLLFELDREEDPSGVSGTGVVARGVVFDDGTIALRWLGSKPSTTFWDCLQDVVDTHGHNGLTRVRIISPKSVLPALPTLAAQDRPRHVTPGVHYPGP